MCGCSARNSAYPIIGGFPWKVTRGDGSVDHYTVREQADYAAALTRGSVEWVGEGPEPQPVAVAAT